MIAKQKIGLIISLAGFAISINTLPTLVSWFSSHLCVTDEWFGIVFLLQYASFTFCSILIGKLHHRKTMPLRRILVLSLLTSSIGLFLLGHIASFFALILLMILIGGCGGLVESIGTALLVDADSNGRMFYSSQFFYALGALFAPFLVSLLLHREMKVPTIGMYVGGFSLFVALVAAILLYQKQKTAEISTVANDEKPILTTSMTSKKIALSMPQNGFTWLFLTMASYVIIESAIANWLPLFLEKAQGKSPADASLILTGYWIGLGLSRLLYVFLNKRTTQFPLIFHSVLILICIAAFLFWGASSSTWITLIIVFFIGIGCGPFWPLLVENCSDLYHDEHLIMYLVSAGSIGGLVGPPLTSLLFSSLGISSMSAILLVYSLILLFMVAKVIILERKE